LSDVIAVPEGDALYMRKIYQLQEAETVIKGRIMRAAFADIWNLLIQLGFTDPQSRIEMFEKSSFYNYLDSLLPYGEGELPEYRLRKYFNASEADVEKLRWIGFFGNEWVNMKEPTPAALLQHQMEKKLTPDASDKDCIVMKHHIEYTLKSVKHTMEATMVAQGENGRDTAISKAVALTTGAAIKACLLDNIKSKGLFIPTSPDIYDPILDELYDLGVAFHVEESKVFGLQEENLLSLHKSA